MPLTLKLVNLLHLLELEMVGGDWAENRTNRIRSIENKKTIEVRNLRH
jgi:hypothetical protein